MDHGIGLTLPQERHPRKFGFVMAVAFGAIGGWLAWRGHGIGPYFLGVAGAFALVALGAPAVLKPVESAWMWLAERIARVGNVVLLTVFFILVITPAGLVFRLFGRDRLGLRSGACDSYWESIPSDDKTDYSKPF